MLLFSSGFIELASDTDRLEEYRRISAINRKHGVDVHEISPQEIQNLFPLCRKLMLYICIISYYIIYTTNCKCVCLLTFCITNFYFLTVINYELVNVKSINYCEYYCNKALMMYWLGFT